MYKGNQKGAFSSVEVKTPFRLDVSHRTLKYFFPTVRLRKCFLLIGNFRPL